MQMLCESRLDPGSKKKLYKSFWGQLAKLVYRRDVGLQCRIIIF